MVTIRLANLADTADQQAIAHLTNEYAKHPMGNGKPLDPAILNRLIPALQKHPTTLIFLAIDPAGECIGIANCFLGFSTFQAKTLINVHDLSVLPTHHGQGIGRQLLQFVQAHAVEIGACAVTLEVRLDNDPARNLYQKLGFKELAAPPSPDCTLFGKWTAPPK